MKPGDRAINHFLSFQRRSNSSSHPFATGILLETTKTMNGGPALDYLFVARGLARNPFSPGSRALDGEEALTGCEHVHTEYDRHANGRIQTGTLPVWMRVNGKVAWYVFQGPYRGLPDAWARFGKELQAMGPGNFPGPPGDVYVCDPVGHKGTEQKLITVFWAPMKE